MSDSEPRPTEQEAEHGRELEGAVLQRALARSLLVMSGRDIQVMIDMCFTELQRRNGRKRARRRGKSSS